MITKNSNPIDLLSGMEVNSTIKMFFQLSHLKQLYRQGWLQRNVPREKCESVSDHSFCVSLFSYFIAKQFYPHLNLEKVLLMSLIHDVGEIYAGDITPSDNVSDEEKHLIEKASILQLFKDFPNRDYYISIWEEYEEKSSPEALFVKEIDKLEMILQASVYEKQGYPITQDFFDCGEKHLSLKELKQILNEIISIRTF